jgi:hypothetical protein
MQMSRGFILAICLPLALVGWMSVECKCSSPNGTTTNYTIVNGTLLSDLDGADGVYRYSYGDSCNWILQCPNSTDYLALYDISGRTASASDSLALIAGGTTTSIANVTLGVFRQLFSSVGFVLNQSTAAIQWNTPSFATSSALNFGFRVSWKCLPTRCSLPMTTSMLLPTLASEAVVPFSGSATPPSTPLAGERCVWNATLPSGASSSLVYFQGTLQGQQTVTVRGQGGSILLNSWTAFSSGFGSMYSGIDNLTVFYNTEYSDALTLSSTTPPVSLVLGARATKCSSKNTSSSYVGPTGILVSDWDGAGSDYDYLNAENCSWSISCPNSSHYLLVDLKGDLTAFGSDYIRISAPNNTQVRRITDRVTSRLWLASSVMNVEFASAASGYTQRGWTLRWMCRPPSDCLATSTNSTPGSTISPNTAGSPTTTRDPFFVGESYGDPVAVGQECAWPISCPTGSSILLTLDMSVSSVYPILVRQNGTGQQLSALTGSYSQTSTILDADSLLLWYNSNGTTSWSGEEWSLTWTCRTSTCSSTRTPPQVPLIAVDGIIESDVDGSGVNPTASGESCLWTIACPAGYSYLYMYAVSYITSFDRLQVQSTNGTVLASFSSTASVLLSTSVVNVIFKSSSYNRGYGFTIRYGCRQKPCSSVTGLGEPLTAASGTVLSDIDGAGPAIPPYSEECLWVIQCPASSFVSATLTLYLASTLRVSDYWTGASLVDYRFYGRTTLANYPTNAIRVTFNGSGSYSSYQGFTVQYSCRPDQCFGAQLTSASVPVSSASSSALDSSTPLYSSGVLSSNPVGFSYSGTYTATGLSCRTVFRCPLATDTLLVEVIGFTDQRPSNFFAITSNFHGVLNTSVPGLYNLTAAEGDRSIGETFVLTLTTDLSAFYTMTGSLSWTCQRQGGPTCSSPNRSDSTFTLLPFDQSTILSDADGLLERFHFRNAESCYFRIGCPTAAPFLRYNAQFNTFYYTAAADKLSLQSSANNSRGSTPLGSLTGGTYAAYPLMGVVDTRAGGVEVALEIRWTSQISSLLSSRVGWAVTVSCSDTKCYSPNATSTNTETVILFNTSVTFLSDVDGAGSQNQLPPDSECQWRIRCIGVGGNTNAFRGGLYVSLAGNLNTNYRFQVSAGKYMNDAPYPNTSTPLTLPLSGYGTDTFYMDGVVASQVGFVSVPQNGTGGANSSPPSAGVTVVTGCAMKPSCAINQPLYNATFGALQSDTDSTECTNRYTAGMSCSWFIDCGIGYSLYVSLSATVGDPSDVPNLVDMDSGGILGPIATPTSYYSTTIFSGATTIPPSRVRVQWNTSLSAANPASRCGWIMRYQCVNRIYASTAAPTQPSQVQCQMRNTRLSLKASTPSIGGGGIFGADSYRALISPSVPCSWSFTCANARSTSTMLISATVEQIDTPPTLVLTSSLNQQIVGTETTGAYAVALSNSEAYASTDMWNAQRNAVLTISTPISQYVNLGLRCFPDTVTEYSVVSGSASLLVGRSATSSVYSNNMNQVTQLVCPYGNVAQIDSILGSTAGSTDYMTVVSEPAGASKTYFGDVDLTGRPLVIGSTILIQFVSDSSGQAEGYRIHSTCVSASDSNSNKEGASNRLGMILGITFGVLGGLLAVVSAAIAIHFVRRNRPSVASTRTPQLATEPFQTTARISSNPIPPNRADWSDADVEMSRIDSQVEELNRRAWEGIQPAVGVPCEIRADRNVPVQIESSPVRFAFRARGSPAPPYPTAPITQLGYPDADLPSYQDAVHFQSVEEAVVGTLVGRVASPRSEDD